MQVTNGVEFKPRTNRDSVNQHLSGIRVSLSNECSEPSAPVYKYCSITSVDVERSFSAYELILMDNTRSFYPENTVAYCGATFCSQWV
jgi:hypothetical protein